MKRSCNTYYMDALAELPDKSNSKDTDKMAIDNIGSKKSGFSRPSDP